jgi:hypothetical protein
MRFHPKHSILALALSAALVTGGCASFNGPDIIPGTTNASYVEANMGSPAEKVALADGSTVWFYPNQPYGRVTYAVTIGRDNIVRSYDQRLNEANLSRIVPDKSSMHDIRALFGPPYHVLRYPNRDGDSWEYNMYGGAGNVYWKILSIRFGADGLVKDVSMVDDPSDPRVQGFDRRGGGLGIGIGGGGGGFGFGFGF